MAELPILCIICMQNIKGDAAYMNHMQTVHGTSHPDQALQIEKAKAQNIPQQPMVTLDPNAPPPPDFMELANMMDSGVPQSQPSDAKPALSVGGKQQQKVVENKPLELRYQWFGNCPQCNTPIRTIMVKTSKNEISAVAYCLSHNEVVQRIVPLLENPNDLYETQTKVITAQNKIIDELKEKEVSKRKYAKHRRKPSIRTTTESKTTLPITRLPESSSESVSNSS